MITTKKAFYLLLLGIFLIAGCSGGGGGGKGSYSDSNPLSPDTYPPTISSITALSENTIKLIFSETVTIDSAEKYENYILKSYENLLTVNSISLQDDNQSVIIGITESMEYSTEYSCTVSGVTDIAGNSMPGSTRKFTGRGKVLAVLSELPSASTNNTGVNVLVSGTDLTNYKFRIDEGTWSTILGSDSRIVLTGLLEGIHKLEVIGSDSLGNWQPENAPTAFIWNVDLTPPVAELDNLPRNITSDSGTDIIVNGVIQYKYKIDGEDWSEIRNGNIIRTELSDDSHTLLVVGRDSAGNWQSESSPTSYTWRIDTSSPVAELSGLPDTLTNRINADIFVSGEGVISYKYMYNGSAWSDETDTALSILIHSLGEGSHSVSVIGKNEAGTWQDTDSATIFNWTVDTTPPAALILSAPANPSSQKSPMILIGGAEVVWYKYKLDSNAWSQFLPASEMLEIGNLSEGSHLIKVIGLDTAGNIQNETDAAQYSWTVDLTPPVAAFVTATLPAVITSSQLENIEIAPSGLTAYRYKIDDSPWSADQNISYNTISLDSNILTEGLHTVQITGKDQAGNWQAAADATVFAWKIDVTPPAVNLQNTPDPVTSSGSASITVTGTDSSSYRYSLDGSSWTTHGMNESIILSGLYEGSHYLEVKGIDAAGNIQTTATTYSWQVDQTASNAVLTGLPATLTNQTAASISVSGSDVVAYKYSLDNSSWSSEISRISPININSLAEGIHSISVVAKDNAGNWQNTSQATTHSWTVDTTPPAVSLSGYPSSATKISAVTVTVSGTDAVSYRYSINNGSWSAETEIGSKISLNLSQGTYILYAIGKDAAGNWQNVSSAAQANLEIDQTAPFPVSISDSGLTSSSSNLQFSWTPGPDNASVKIQISTDSSFSNIIFGSTDGAVIPNTGSFTYPASSADGSTYYARIKVADAADNWSAFGTSSDGISLVGSVKINIRNTSGQPVSGANVKIKDLSGNIVSTLSTDSSGFVNFPNITVGTNSYSLDVSASLYNSAVKNNVSVNTGSVSDQGILYLVPVGAQSGVFTGKVVDANNGKIISGATVKFIDWSGTVINTRTSDANGAFTSSTLTPGTYSIAISYSGYFDLLVDNQAINGNKSLGDQSMCEHLPPYQLRVVLLWGSSPSDLDLHVVGQSNSVVTDSDGASNRFHVFWKEKKSFTENSATYSPNADPSGSFATASLVQDAQNGYGPEAINLFKLSDGSQYANGIYTFTVHKYVRTGTWYDTPITVRIYDSEGLWQEIPVPSGAGSERFWKVFQVDMQGAGRNQRTLTVENTFATLDYTSKTSMDWQLSPGGLGGYLLAVAGGDVKAILLLLAAVMSVIGATYFLARKTVNKLKDN